MRYGVKRSRMDTCLIISVGQILELTFYIKFDEGLYGEGRMKGQILRRFVLVALVKL
jgi:hypothetical protein